MKKNQTRQFSMDIQQVKDILREEASRLEALAERISDNLGIPMSAADKRSVRSALLNSWLPPVLDETKYFLAEGHMDDAQSNMEFISETFHPFT